MIFSKVIVFDLVTVIYIYVLHGYTVAIRPLSQSSVFLHIYVQEAERRSGKIRSGGAAHLPSVL